VETTFTIEGPISDLTSAGNPISLPGNDVGLLLATGDGGWQEVINMN
jgi:hypothetical protein